MNQTNISTEWAQEQREYRRVTVSIAGRYMLEDRREFPCRTIDFSPDSVSMAVPVRGKVGERVVAYLDYIGRIEGIIIRRTLFGFALLLNLPGNKREKIAHQLSWLVNREALGQADRRHDRVVPHFKHCMLQLEDGAEHLVKLIDVSLSGAGIKTDLHIPIGTKVSLGSKTGKVVRHFENGLAVEFDSPFPIGQFDENIRL